MLVILCCCGAFKNRQRSTDSGLSTEREQERVRVETERVEMGRVERARERPRDVVEVELGIVDSNAREREREKEREREREREREKEKEKKKEREKEKERERERERERREQRPDTFYHATTEENALRIQEEGFVIPDGPGGLLGPGVYCTTTLTKAMEYLKGRYGGVVLELKIDLGNCKQLVENDPMMRTWQNNYDSAWAPFSARDPSDKGKQENCVKDPNRINVVRVFAGNTGELRRGGFEIVNDKLRKVGFAGTWGYNT